MNIPGTIDDHIDQSLTNVADIVGYSHMNNEESDIANSHFKYDNIREIKNRWINSNDMSCDWEHLYTIAFIRNPWRRSYDIYKSYKYLESIEWSGVNKLRAGIKDFKTFLKHTHLLCPGQHHYIYKTPDVAKNTFNTPLVSTSHSMTIQNRHRCGGSLVKLVIKSDHPVDNKTKLILDRWNVPHELLDFQQDDTYKNLYDDKMKEIISELYQDDINFFQYKF